MTRVLVFFGLGYLCLFPFAYFRHDDWLILGNAVFHLVDSWDFAWKPTLFYGDWETPWFFRPLFKLMVLLFYKVYAFAYWKWLTTLLVMAMAALALSAHLVARVSGQKSRGTLLGILLATSLPLHFGSLLWAGEGMMNIPQLLMLVGSAVLFIEGVMTIRGKRYLLLSLGYLAFVFSLGFKESAIFHPFFLAAIMLCEDRFRNMPMRARLALLSPYFLTLPIFLWIRLVRMPLNVHYIPVWDFMHFVKPVAFSLAVPCIVLLLWRMMEGKRGSLPLFLMTAIQRKWAYLFCFGASITPYLGHGFFSTGWLLLPGFYFLFFFVASVPWELGFERRMFRYGSVVLGTFAIPVLIFLNMMGWWQWNEPQRKLQSIVETASPEKIKRIVVFGCPNPEYPKSKFTRVVAFEASLYFLWALRQPTKASVKIHPCDSDHPDLRDEAINAGDALVLQWKFPEIKILPSKPEKNPVG